jgi:isoleucyl-tRNA synthetase
MAQAVACLPNPEFKPPSHQKKKIQDKYHLTNPIDSNCHFTGHQEYVTTSFFSAITSIKENLEDKEILFSMHRLSHLVTISWRNSGVSTPL